MQRHNPTRASYLWMGLGLVVLSLSLVWAELYPPTQIIDYINNCKKCYVYRLICHYKIYFYVEGICQNVSTNLGWMKMFSLSLRVEQSNIYNTFLGLYMMRSNYKHLNSYLIPITYFEAWWFWFRERFFFFLDSYNILLTKQLQLFSI